MKPKSIKFVPMTISEADKLLRQLQLIYDPREAGNIADLVLESVTGLRKMDRLMEKHGHLNEAAEASLRRYIAALLDHEPVQYVLGEAWFYGYKFFVDRNVLIPRPETEELVHWIIEENKDKNSLSVIDLGTGSGCIPIALKKQLPAATISACDISEGALAVARKNASLLAAAVDFFVMDILDRNRWKDIPEVDIIASNPPYIPAKDGVTLKTNVSAYEPHQALFVPDDDPLLFYRAIAGLGTEKLCNGGAIYVETHEDLGEQTAEVFRVAGYFSVEIRKDMQGKQRMVRAIFGG